MKKTLIILLGLMLVLTGCTTAPQDKLHLLNEEPVTVELGSDLDLTLENYLDTSKLSEEDLNNVTIKLVSAIKNSEGKIDPNAKEVESKELGFGSKAILITLNDEQEVIDVIAKDTTKPEFTKTKDEYEITEGDKLPDIKKDFEAKDLSDVTISVDTDEVKNDKAGEYKATVTATDTSGNKTEHEVTITVKEKPKQTVSTPSYSGGSSSGSSSSNGGSSSGSGSSSNSGGQSQSTARYRTDISNTYFSQINNLRASLGGPTLPWSQQAQSIADRRAKELSVNYGHAAVGFSENIGNGSAGADFFTAWKNSPGHYQTMIDGTPASTHVGYSSMAVSVYETGGRWYAITVFMP